MACWDEMILTLFHHVVYLCYLLYYDKASTPVSFVVSDQVWFYNPSLSETHSRKLKASWHGPFILHAQTTPEHFFIRRVGETKVSNRAYHVARFKPYVQRKILPPDPPILPKSVQEDMETEARLEEKDANAEVENENDKTVKIQETEKIVPSK